jgi:hypothetical protein
MIEVTRKLYFMIPMTFEKCDVQIPGYLHIILHQH